GTQKSFGRKAREAFLAFRVENELNKEEILALYLNQGYLGERAYGVGAAAQTYYGTDVASLTLAQTAMIAGLFQSPSAANPLVNEKRALARRGYVLGRMLADGYIDKTTYAQAMAEPDTAGFHGDATEVAAPYMAELARNYMVDKYGDDAYTEGYSVVTTIDSRLQPLAVKAVRDGLQAYDERHGWRGATAHVDLPARLTDDDLDKVVGDRDHVGGLFPAVVTKVDAQSAELYVDGAGSVKLGWDGIKWAHKFINQNGTGPAPKTAGEILSRGDVVYLGRQPDGNWTLAQVPTAQSALVAMDPTDGAVVAMVGGFDYDASKYNRATQAHRQAGSSFKPFIYSAALENGFTTATVVPNAPVVLNDAANGQVWRPHNFEGDFSGPTRLRNALAHSLNLVTIRVLQQMGIDKTIQYDQNFGFTPDELPHDLTMALGSGSFEPVEMARAYSVFANRGYRVTPYYIQSVLDGTGKVLFQATPDVACDSCKLPDKGDPAISMPQGAPVAITPQNAWLMTSLMQEVIKTGTGVAAQSLGRPDIAGKTGTSNDFTDAWFDGFTSHLVTVVWVGNDQPSQPLGNGEQGALAALPIWMEFMGPALTGVPIPKDPFPRPFGIEDARIDPNTGLLANADDPESIWEFFENGKLPPKQADKKKQPDNPDIF
ncbi:MAG TPA: penicillin-binding transpeptidase domain-containing protein, partial [Gammaproteobacteria bacterium]|nr:penicillin-binding transpeptidase domain-containing protein [Gammaproteobacteria bacterium]